MTRVRMLTPGFRLFFGLALFLFAAAFVFGVATELQVEGETVGQVIEAKGSIEAVTGPMSMGWKGGVGNHLGYSLLLMAAGAAALVAGTLIAFRDADPEAQASYLGLEAPPRTRAPGGASYAPIIGAFSVALIGLGWAVGSYILWAGVLVLVLDGLLWTVRAWAERATGDDDVNYQLYKKMVDPVRVPLVALIVFGFVVFGLSRVLLAVPSETTSLLVFLVVPAVAFVVLILLALRPQVGKALLTIVLVIGGIAILGGLVFGAVRGEREFEPVGTEQLVPGGNGFQPAPEVEGESHGGGTGEGTGTETPADQQQPAGEGSSGPIGAGATR